MGKRGVGAWVAAVALVAVTSGTARADLTASYDGSLNGPKGAALTLAGVLNQASGAVSGTLAVESSNPAAAGLFWVTGSVQGKRLALTGNNAQGVRIKWRAAVKDAVLRGPAKLKGAGVRVGGALVLSRRNADPPGSPPSTCDNAFFTGQVMGRVLQPICANCHVAGGAAATANFRVTPNDPLATEASVALNIDKANPDQSRILLKPLNQIPHAGGQQLAAGSAELQILQQWANLVATDQQCSALPVAKMVPLSPSALLVRASMDARGMRPSTAELDQIEADPNSYPAIVESYLHSPEFLERVKDAYDDALLVRREDFTDEARDKTSAIYGEALELIAYIVANDRPFTEIGTADYTVANQLFQSDPTRMPYPMEPVTGDAWQPTHYTDGRPHAGLLSTSAFYQVWDTNNTNKNRRRANRWSIVFHCYNFLDTPVDVTRNVDNNDPNAVLNAVTTRPDCKACHDKLDPMASFLFPLDNAQALEGDGNAADFFNGNPERWRTANRRPPAVYGTNGSDIRDMGRLMTAHPKFAECQTKRAFKMLFLRDPQSNAELATASDIQAKWPTEDGYNYRALVRRWMLSDVYTNHPESDDAAWVRRTNPERLELTLKDLTGFVWARDPENDEDDNNPMSDPPRTAPVPLLTNEEEGFKIILGGINGVSVAGRSYGLNASVALVQRKVASLAADFVVTNDLALPDGQRKLLNGVTGAEDPTADETALRNAIASLVRRLYGDKVAPTSAQVDGWLTLYRALYADRTQSSQVMGTAPQRAWRGMLTGMLRSPRIVLY